MMNREDDLLGEELMDLEEHPKPAVKAPSTLSIKTGPRSSKSSKYAGKKNPPLGNMPLML